MPLVQRLGEATREAASFGDDHHHNHRPTAFYVDCRLYKVGPDDAEFSRQQVGKGDPALPGESPRVEEEEWQEDAEDATDFSMNCRQVQGLFEKKVVRLYLNDYMVFKNKMFTDVANVKALHDQHIQPTPMDVPMMMKPGFDAPGAIWIFHSPSKSWYKCFIEGFAKEAMLKCMPYLAQSGSSLCGFRVCNQDRKTYKTLCLKKQTSSLLATFTGGMFFKQCIYVGHGAELQPKDIAGKPVNYGVFILQSPAPLLLPPVAQLGAQFLGWSDAQLERGSLPLEARRCQRLPSPRTARRCHAGWSFLGHAA